MSWRTFVRSHAHLIAAADFFTTEVWTAMGLATHYTLFLIDIATRRVHALRDSGIEILLTAYQGPNMNAYAGRFVRSIKPECLDRMIFLGQASLDRAVAEYGAHYHVERSHQGLGNELISRAEPQTEGAVQTRERLGGLLKYYHRQAA